MEIFDIRPSEKQKGLIFFQKNLQLQKKLAIKNLYGFYCKKVKDKKEKSSMINTRRITQVNRKLVRISNLIWGL